MELSKIPTVMGVRWQDHEECLNLTPIFCIVVLFFYNNILEKSILIRMF